MTYEDLELWSNDPKKYLSEKVEKTNSLFTKRYNSSKLFSSLFSYKEDKKSNPIYCQALFEFLCKCLINGNEKLTIEKNNLLNNNKPYYLIYNEIYFCLRKESILYLLKNNNNIIKKYLKKYFENFIEKKIFPEFNFPCAFLKEQACSFFKSFNTYKYTNNNLVVNLANNFSYLMKNDPILPVRFESAMALCSIINNNNIKKLLKGYIQILLQIYLKLMEETDLEEIMNNLQELVNNLLKKVKYILWN